MRRNETFNFSEETISQQPNTSSTNIGSEEDEVIVNRDDFEDLVLPSDPLVDLNTKREIAANEEEPVSKEI